MKDGVFLARLRAIVTFGKSYKLLHVRSATFSISSVAVEELDTLLSALKMCPFYTEV